MAYATSSDISDLYGLDELNRAADRDGDGSANAETITRAFDDASAEMDAYLSQQYNLPITVSTPLLKRLCVDIALYRMVLESGRWTEEHRTRYKDAVSLLEKIAAGKASLGAVTSGEGDEAETLSPTTSSVVNLARG
jgi:phage gp36-like protein